MGRDRLGADATGIAFVATAVVPGVGVEELDIGASLRNPDAVAALGEAGEVEGDGHEVRWIGTPAQEREYAVEAVAAVDPGEAAGLAVSLVEAVWPR